MSRMSSHVGSLDVDEDEGDGALLMKVSLSLRSVIV